MPRPLLALVVVSGVVAAAGLAPCQAQDVPAGVSELLSRWEGEGDPGLVVSVVAGGERVLTHAVGLAHLEHGVPITGDTIFHTASVSKQFTAAAVLMLEGEGRLALDDDVRSHLPELPDFGATIRLRHLLWHTSGLRDQWQILGAAGWREDDVVTDEHVWRALLRQRELNFEPGSREMYCNTGFSLLAAVVERISGKPLSVYCEEMIFEPLGMHSTQFHDDVHRVVPGRAESYVRSGGAWRRFGLSFGTVGATGLLTTADDLSLWAAELMTGRALGDDLVGRLRTPGSLESGEAISYAGGLFVDETRGVRSVGHPGADSGFRAAVRCFPDQDLAVVVLANRPDLDVWGMPTAIASHYIGDAMEPAFRRLPDDPDADERRAWQGTYRNSIDGRTVQVLDRFGRLRVWEAGTRTRLEGVIRGDGSVAVDGLGWVLTAEARESGRVSEVGIVAMAGAGRLTRVESIGAPDDHVGTYRSEELDTSYELRAHAEGVLAVHFRNEPVVLRPGLPDIYGGGAWYFNEIELVRGPDGSVEGFLLHNSRARNMWFERE